MQDIFLGDSGEWRVELALKMTNRHGLITGATGTGKTVSLQVLVEGFSRAGVPAFVTDIKGDLSGLAKPIKLNEKIASRLLRTGQDDFMPRAFPVILWDIFGKQGHPIRTTISDMGPLLLSHLLGLNNVQTSILYACFKISDDEGLLLLDLKDLRSLLSWMSYNSKSLQARYGNVSAASIAAIQRALLVLEHEGAEQFLSEPVLQLRDMMQTDFSGNGVVSLLDATTLLQKPKLYATFLLWLLSELFEQLPEVGDRDKPNLVLFFDEAHLLFDNAPEVLLDKVEQAVRLIRSKGVGVYFVSQTPMDIPVNIAGQLGNRIQHALRAFTPKDQKAVRTAAQTLRPNPNLNTEQVISQLGIGEALVSVLDQEGQPTPVERITMAVPQSQIGPLSADERQEHLERSPLAGRYDAVIDRESAYELLQARGREVLAASSPPMPQGSVIEDLVSVAAKSAVRSIGSQMGRQLARGLLGSLMGRRRR